MDDDKLYDFISKIMQKITELENRNAMIEDYITNKLQGGISQPMVVEDRVEPDERNIQASKKTITPEGSLITVVSKPFCVSGRHLIKDEDDILFCSKCGRTICKEHAVGNPVLCYDCARSLINLDDEEAYVLYCLVNKIEPEYEVSDYASIIDSLEGKGYVKRKFFFSVKPTLKGVNAIRLLEQIYNGRNGGEDQENQESESDN